MSHPEKTAGFRLVRGAVIAALVIGVVAASGCAGPERHRRAGRHGFTGDTGTVHIVSAEIGGKNVFIPSTIAVKSGAPVIISIYNTTEKPHGFSIPALGIAEVIPVGEEYAVELPALEGHQLLQINCHLHATHRTASLIVLPAGKPGGPHEK